MKHSGYFMARLALCSAFLFSGTAKTVDFQAAVAEQAHFGLTPPAFFAAATIAIQLSGSLLMLSGIVRRRQAGAALLAIFTLAATVIGHRFWRESGIERFRDLNSFVEHIGLIGGFFLVILDTGSGGSIMTRR